MGFFLVMYKNVPLIAAHSCGGACWKIPSLLQAPGPPLLGNVSPHQPNTQSGVQVPIPPPLLCSTPFSFHSRLGTHTVVCTEIQSDA